MWSKVFHISQSYFFGISCRFLNQGLKYDPYKANKDVFTNNSTKSSLNVKESTLKSGVRILTTKHEIPFTSTKIIFEAGSRYEDSSNIGVTHGIRANLLMSNKKHTLINMARSVGHLGASVNISCNRDNIIIDVKSLPQHSSTILEKIASSITQPIYYHWEVADSYDWIVPEINSVRYGDIKQYAFDELHRAMYRNKLGNSLYLDPSNVAKLTREHMINYHSKYFCGSKCTVISTGYQHSSFEKLIDEILALPFGQSSIDEKLPVYPCEVRILNDNSWTHLAVGYQSVGYKNSDLPIFLILEALFGSYDYSFYSIGFQGRLSKEINQLNNGIVKSNSFNISYKDNGLFGFYASAPNTHTSQIIDKLFNVINGLKDFKLSEEEFNNSRNKAKLRILNALEDSDSLLINLGFKNSILADSEKLLLSIDSLTINDFERVVKDLNKQRPTFVAIGDVNKVAPLDELLRK